LFKPRRTKRRSQQEREKPRQKSQTTERRVSKGEKIKQAREISDRGGESSRERAVEKVENSRHGEEDSTRERTFNNGEKSQTGQR